MEIGATSSPNPEGASVVHGSTVLRTTLETVGTLIESVAMADATLATIAAHPESPVDPSLTAELERHREHSAADIVKAIQFAIDVRTAELTARQQQQIQDKG